MTYVPAPPPPELGELLASLAASTRSSTRQQRRAEARAAAKRARSEKRAAFHAKLAAAGGAHCKPREIPRRVRARVRAIHETRSGVEAVKAVRELPPHWQARVRLIARTPKTGRELSADLHEKWSRLVVACAWWLHASRRRSKRNGYSHVVDGYTQAMVCALFRNEEGDPYTRGRLYATSYRKDSDEKGPMVALREAELIHYAQPRNEDANPRYTGPPRPTGRFLSDGTPELRCFPFGIHWLDTGPPS